MLKYLIARFLDISKNTYYFFFILTKKVVLHRSPKTLLAKNNIVLSASSCRGMLGKFGFCTALACCGMNGACRGMSASGFWLEGLMLRHGKTMLRHALMTCPILLPLTAFCFNIYSFFDHSTRTSPTRWKHTLKCLKQVINNTKH